ncbi:hypothetical protein ACFW7J_21715 [Streptomyces sp. NPDC059525]|uniref:hypothetical protein n=1 Tax=Streptomyces sp. NPDC059525 TaxID=3346857 RepID=UPI00368BE7EA
MAAIATATAMAPAILGATPAVAAEALDEAVTVPDRSPAEDSRYDVTDLSEDAAGNAESLADRAAKSATEPGVPVPDEPTAEPATEEKPSNLVETADVTPGTDEEYKPSAGQGDREAEQGRPTGEQEQTTGETEDAVAAVATPAPQTPVLQGKARRPALPLQNVNPPSKAEAGGKWAEFTTALDNSKGVFGDESGYDLTLSFSPTHVAKGELREGDFELQYFRQGAWHDAQLTYKPGKFGDLTATFADNSFPAELITHGFRFRVSKSTSLSAISISSSVTYFDRETGKAFKVASKGFETEIVPLSGEEPGTGEDPGKGEDLGSGEEDRNPSGAGSSEANQADSNDQTVTDIGFTGDGKHDSGPEGALARTGSDAATRWTLGAGGAALALGAALVAGTGRHRRRRSSEPA